MHVFISGPLTSTPRGPFPAVHDAVKVSTRLMRAGLVPFVPHTAVLVDMIEPGLTWDEWMLWCLHWVERCDAVLRLPGESRGADREVAHAEALGIPVYFSEADLLDAARSRQAVRLDTLRRRWPAVKGRVLAED
jgi:nucleoside 2-deoxyribosyltransferase